MSLFPTPDPPPPNFPSQHCNQLSQPPRVSILPTSYTEGSWTREGRGSQGHTESLGQDCVFPGSPLESQIREEHFRPCPYQGALQTDFCSAGLRAEASPHQPGGGREAWRIGLMEQELETGAR